MAIAFDSNKILLKKLSLSTLNNRKEFEIVAARGKLRNYKKEITIFSCYIAPKLSKTDSAAFMETLSDAISEAKSTSEGWFVLGGDWNNRSLSGLLDMYPDISQLVTPPTRKDNTLDIFLTNLNCHIKTTAVCSPLEGEVGQKSDHKIVIFESLLPRPKSFTWEVHEYLQVTKVGSERFIELLKNETWQTVLSEWPNQDRMTINFHRILETHIDSCFSWKRVRRKSSDKPWISDAIRTRIKHRRAIFRLEGRSELWKRIDKGIQQTIAFRKRAYEDKMCSRLEQSGRSSKWYSIYKNLLSDDMPARWSVTELEPDQQPIDLANNLAEHFSKITNMSRPLDMKKDIPRSEIGPGLIPQLDRGHVEDVLKKFKKCSSRVTGDIPRELVNPCARSLSTALTPIYNACLLNKAWPDIWKVETVIPIPKTISPGGMDDLRPISMTTLWSKLLESFVATFTLDESKNNWKKSQFGGRKGASTDHVLVSLWDRILTGLDKGNKAVVLSGIDFSKSFSRCSY